MKNKITFRAYSKAKRIVEAYEKIQHVRKVTKETVGYAFLYWLNNNEIENIDDSRVKYIKAKNIEAACAKFILKKPQSLTAVDYEVCFGENYIDISNIEVIKEFIH